MGIMEFFWGFIEELDVERLEQSLVHSNYISVSIPGNDYSYIVHRLVLGNLV